MRYRAFRCPPIPPGGASGANGKGFDDDSNDDDEGGSSAGSVADDEEGSDAGFEDVDEGSNGDGVGQPSQCDWHDGMHSACTALIPQGCGGAGVGFVQPADVHVHMSRVLHFVVMG